MARLRISPRAYARITLVALALLVVIIITGAAVRLTGSGLGCPDWPTCANNRVVAPVSYHPLIEFTNRCFTGLVSIAVILAVLGSLFRTPRRKDLTWLSLSLVLGVVVQAVLGGLAVLNKLRPEWVMAHFIASMFLIWAALVLHNRASQPDTRAVQIMHRDYIILGRIMCVLTAIVIFVGTMVTGSGPHGGDEHVKRLDFKLHDISKVHGSIVWLLIAFTVLTLWRLNVAGASAKLTKRGEMVVLALFLQGAIGYVQYATHLPAWLVLIHIVGACAVWLSVLWFNLGFYERYPDLGLQAYDGDAYPAMTGAMASEPPPLPEPEQQNSPPPVATETGS